MTSRLQSSDYFSDLGTKIEARFRAAEYDEEQFPDIAAEALASNPASGSVDPVALLQDVAAYGPLPRQLSETSKFGQPPFTVHAGPRFVVDVYFWFEGTTSTHEHGFCGAFQVVGGSSLHARRSFRCTRRVNSRFLLGDVRTEEAEVLNAGDTRRILGGTRFAHALFHLDSPSTTVVVRTRSNPDAQPQYTYEAPHVAIDRFFTPRNRELQLESFGALRKMGPEPYFVALERALEQATVEDTYHFLEGHAEWCYAEDGALTTERFTRAASVARRSHGDATIDLLVPSLLETCRQTDITQGRALTNDADERFVLAVLLNAQSRKDVVDFLRTRRAGTTEAMAIDQFMETFGRMALRRDDDEESALGFSLGADALEIVRHLLAGAAPGELAARLVASGRDAALVAREAGTLEKLVAQLLETPVLRVLAL